MVLDIYTDAGIHTRSKSIQIAAIAVDEKENVYHFVEKTSADQIKNLWNEFNSVSFRADSTMGEMYAIYKTFTELHKLNVSISEVNIYTDSLNSFNFINEVNKDILTNPDSVTGYISNAKTIVPRCRLTKMINNHIKKFKKELESKNIKVNIRWIKGHGPCYFNLAVDKLCKPRTKQVNNLQEIKD